MATPMFIEIQNWDSTSKRFTLAEQVSHQPTLELTTGGQTQSVDMSCLVDTITDSISLDARCDETVTPGTAEPFDDYILSGNIDTLLLEQDGTISDLLHTNAIPSSSAARGSFTMELYNPSSTDGLAIVLYAKQSSGSDSSNDYSNLDPEADFQKCATLADFLAAGEQGLPLPYVGESTLSGVPSLAENETLYASVVSNGNNSYTFTFTVRTPEVTEQELTLDLVSGNNRVDMKPLLEHIGGKIEMRPSSELAPMMIDDGESEPVFPIVHINNVVFADTVEDLMNGTNLHYPTDEHIETNAYTACLSATPLRSVASGPAFYQLAFGVYTSSDDRNVVMYVPDFGGDISNPDFTYYSLDTLLAAGASGVPTIGRDMQTSEIVESPYRIRASQVDNCYVFEIVSSAIAPTLCLEPSCDPCIDLSPLLNSTLGSVQGSFSCDSPILDRISFGVYYNGQSVGTTQYADFGGSLTIGRSNVSSFYLSAGVSSHNETYVSYFGGSSTSDTITFASLSVGSEVTLAPRNTVPSGFPAEIRLVVTAIPGTNQATFEVQDSREPMPTLTLTSTQKSGTATEQSIDMSCLTDIIGDTSVSGELFCGGLRNHGIRSVHLKCYDSNDTLLSNVSATINSDGTFTATLPAGCDHFTVRYVESGTQPQYYEADIIASELAVGYVACDIRSGGEEM